MTAYQITSIMEGVIQRGTATSLKSLNRPLAGKTGTTNEEKDAWFIGFTPDLVVGVFVGFDTPRRHGQGQHRRPRGGARIFGSFMKMALAETPAVPFRIPPGIKLVRVNLRTGLRASPDDPQAIVEAFKPNEEPDDAYSVIGFPDPAASVGGPDEAAQQGSWQPAPQRRTGLRRRPRRYVVASFAAGAVFSRAPPRRSHSCVTLRIAFTAVSTPPICRRDPQHLHAIREAAMRAEAQKLVSSIQEALVLLRRHL